MLLSEKSHLINQGQLHPGVIGVTTVHMTSIGNHPAYNITENEIEFYAHGSFRHILKQRISEAIACISNES